MTGQTIDIATDVSGREARSRASGCRERRVIGKGPEGREVDVAEVGSSVCPGSTGSLENSDALNSNRVLGK